MKVVREDPSGLGGNLMGHDPDTWHPALWTYLIERFSVRSALDVGCGEGHCVRFFRDDAGLRATGIDGLAINVREAVTPITLHDLRDGPYIQPVDLVHCCEVVEHIDEEFLDNLLLTLANGRVIAMTHALPGQPGYHHVNCQDDSYWITHIEALGYKWRVQETVEAKQRVSDDHWTYFVRSGLIFERIR